MLSRFLSRSEVLLYVQQVDGQDAPLVTIKQADGIARRIGELAEFGVEVLKV